jgi:hypothetical protein
MKNVSKLVTAIFFLGVITLSNAQNKQTGGVEFILDMKPVLQLDMSSPEQVNFVFDEKGKYYAGITKKAATVLKVTSTVKWDLYAVGRSKGKSPNGKTYWDQENSYATTINSVADLPLSLLELKQNTANKATDVSKGNYSDYSQNFPNAFRPNGGNSLYVSQDGTPTPPSSTGKYIAGHSGISEGAVNGAMESGSYASNNGAEGNFLYVIDYKISPGFPAIFPNAFNADASIAENIVSTANSNTALAGGAATSGNSSHAEAGYYTMNVQYVLLEDQ